MKRLFSIAILALILVLVTYVPVGAETLVRQMSTLSAVTVSTSDEIDTTSAININDWDFVSAVLEIDWASGGSNGTGYMKFQGRAKAGTGMWRDLYVVNVVDSFEVQANLNWGTALAADAVIAGVLSFFPATTTWDDDDVSLALVGGTLVNALPCEEIRAIVFDDSWDAVATFTGYWILRRE